MLTLQEIQELMSKLNNWSLEANSITKVFSFSNFKEVLEFVNKVGEIAEKHSHYPDFIISQNTVRLSLTTHSEKAITKKDFEVAEEIDHLS